MLRCDTCHAFLKINMPFLNVLGQFCLFLNKKSSFCLFLRFCLFIFYIRLHLGYFWICSNRKI